jgi:hypothetical protein
MHFLHGSIALAARVSPLIGMGVPPISSGEGAAALARIIFIPPCWT